MSGFLKYKKEQIEELANLYNTGSIKMAELDRKFNIDLGYQCKVHNVLLKRSKYRELHRKNEILYDFSEITNDFEAYTLGLIFSDGWINRNSLGIKLIKSDIEVIKSINNYIIPTKKVLIEKNSCKFSLNSVDVIQNLQKLGIKYRKSYEEMNLPILPDNLYSSFIRGVFDGDGTIFLDRGNNCPRLRANICCTSRIFLEEVQQVLTNNGIESKIYVETRVGKKMKTPTGFCNNCRNMYRLFPLKKEGIAKFRDFIYQNNSICLKRKFDKFHSNVNTEVNS